MQLLKEYTWLVLLMVGVVLVHPAQAQVVIKERVEVVPAASKADSSAQPTGIMFSIQQAGEFVYTAPEDGRFKVYYLQAERYGEALAADSALQVRIEREDEPEQACGTCTFWRAGRGTIRDLHRGLALLRRRAVSMVCALRPGLGTGCLGL
jgi:hypothetical protein